MGIPSRALLSALVLLSAASCKTLSDFPDQFSDLLDQDPAQDPTVRIEGPGGTELGVSTDYGVVFLGRTAQSGVVDIIAWFGDGPSFEFGVVEPVGPGLFTSETEILLPTVAMTFEKPAAGQEVIVRGRKGSQPWFEVGEVTHDPRVDGFVLKAEGTLLELGDGQIGAGVYIGDPGRERLLGLVSGRLRLRGSEGWREYITVVGPETLWRLVTYRRNLTRQHRWVYREDIL